MKGQVFNGTQTQDKALQQDPYGKVPYAEGGEQANPRQSASQSVITYFKAHPAHLLVFWLGSVAVVRFHLAINHPSFLGIDGGAYLLGMYQYWGDGPAQTGFDRPPLAPGFLLVPFVWIWGVTPLAYNLFAAFFSMAVWPAFWLLARAILPFKWAAIALIFITLDWQAWIMFVTGVVPIVGFAGICVVLWGMLRTSENPTRASKAAILLGIPFIALANQTSAGIALLTLPAALLMLGDRRRVLVWLGLGLALALALALSWYVNLAPGASETRYPGPLFYLTPLTQYQWQQAGFTLLFLLFVSFVWKQAPPGIKMLSFVVGAHMPFLLLWSSDESIMNVLFRGGIWIMIPFWLLVAWMLSQWGYRHKNAVIAGIVAVGILGANAAWQKQPLYSDYFSADMLAATESLDLSTVSRIGTNGSSRAWWLTAVTGKDAVWVMSIASPDAWAERDALAYCELGWTPDCAKGDISHWIIDKTNRQSVPAPIHAAPDPYNPWTMESAPWLTKVWEQGQVEVWTW